MSFICEYQGCRSCEFPCETVTRITASTNHSLQETSMAQTALILGANGRFGHAMHKAMRAAGWSVRTFDRRFER